MTPTEWLTRREATNQGVDPDFAAAIVKQETGHLQGPRRLNARSPKGAIGPMQLMPETAKSLGVDPHDVIQNIQGGVKYLKQQQDEFGDQKLAAAAYNAGPGAVRQYKGVPPYKETQNYVAKVAPDVPESNEMSGKIANFLSKRKPSEPTAKPSGDAFAGASVSDANAPQSEFKQSFKKRRAEIQAPAFQGARAEGAVTPEPTFVQKLGSGIERVGGGLMSSVGTGIAGAGKLLHVKPTQELGEGMVRVGEHAKKQGTAHGSGGLIGQVEEAAGSVAPVLAVPGGAVGMGAVGGLQSYGSGATLPEAVLQGAVTGVGMAGGGALANKIPLNGIPGWAAKTGAATLGMEIPAIAASGHIPTVQEALPNAILMGGLQAMHGIEPRTRRPVEMPAEAPPAPQTEAGVAHPTERPVEQFLKRKYAETPVEAAATPEPSVIAPEPVKAAQEAPQAQGRAPEPRIEPVTKAVAPENVIQQSPSLEPQPPIPDVLPKEAQTVRESTPQAVETQAAPIAPKVGGEANVAPAIKAWAGKAQIIERPLETRYEDYATGKPVVVRANHGTNAPPFETFDASKGQNVWSERFKTPTFFGADHPDVAATYGKRVEPVYMKFEKPLVIDAKGEDFTKALELTEDQLPISQNASKREFQSYRDSLAEKYGEEEWNYGNPATPAETKKLEALQRKADADKSEDYQHGGYDGVIVKNVIDQTTGDNLQPTTVYVAFDPKQMRFVPSEANPQGSEAKGDRRTNPAERQRVSQMTPEQMQRELLTNPVTDLPNKRAYEEAPKKAIQVQSDVDGLKAINDHLGHEAGNELLRAKAQALKDEGVEAYHISGDEFTHQFDTPEQAHEAMNKVAERLKGATIEVTLPDGRTLRYEGPAFSYGVGATPLEAEGNLQANKLAREQSGDRQARGEKPARLGEVTPEGQQAQSTPPAQEVTHHSQLQPRTEEGKFNGPPAEPTGGKERALPKTLEAAELEGGKNRTYQPTSILRGSEEGRQIVKEKGVDGAIEHVLHGNAGGEWASTGYAAMEQLRAEEAQHRANDPAKADEIAAKRLKFVGDFAAEATKRGQAIAGIRAIEEFAPDRAVYEANRLSQGKRKRGLNPQEEARISKIGTDLQVARDRIKTLEATLEAQAATKTRTKTETKKANYQSRLDEQGEIAKAALAAKLGKLDLGNLGRAGERGAVKVGEPPLPGDAELVAQYAASQLAKLNSVADLNAHLTKEFGPQIESILPDVRRRAMAIRQEARLAEIAESTPERRRTILQDIQKEIADLNKRARETEQQARKVEADSKKRASREGVNQADEAARVKRIQEGLDVEGEREALRQARRNSVEADRANKKAYREDNKTRRQAERTAQLWDTPLRNQATEARTRLTGADPKAPETMDDLVSVATEMLLPEKAGGAPHGRSIIPGKFYVDLKAQFPDLVTRKDQGEIYKRAYQRVQDMTTAAREAARLKSASKEERRLWNEMGIDTDAQALLIQRAEAQRQQLEARSAMAGEFNRVSRSKLGRIGFELQSMPRALQSSIDAPLGRQNLFYLITHPIETARFTIPATAKGYAALKHGDYQRLSKEITDHPDYNLAKKAELDLPGLASEGDPRVSAEESFQSTWAERLPHVRLSEQGFTHGMNTARMAAFSRYADLGRASGYTFENNPEFFRQAAKYVNAATGRGNMPETLKRATALTNALFYSTRLQVSRVQLLNNLLNPVQYMKMDPVMRKAAAGEAIRLAAGMALILGTAKAAGLKVTGDPDDPDFGKVVAGAIHYDLTAGQGALIRAAYRFISSAAKQSTGEKLSKSQEPLSILWQFTRSKLAPWPGAAVNMLAGKDMVGHPSNISFKNPEKKPAGKYIQDLQDQNQIVRMVAPMIAGDFIDAANEEGWAGVAKTAPALGGIGMQAYQPKQKTGSTYSGGASPYGGSSTSPYARR